MLRRAEEPDAVPDETLGALMMASLELYTRPKGDPRNQGEWLTDAGKSWRTPA
jgi:hypothetical protein